MTDARTVAALDASLRALPRGAGVIFRHYHLPPDERRTAFARVARLCRAHGLIAVLSGSARQAAAWGASGCYGPPELLAPGPAMLRLATAHSLAELGRAATTRADAVLLSPVFPTCTHPGAPTLGPLRFRVLARQSPVRVVALGGMTPRSARRLPNTAWAAIDGLAKKARIPKDS
jgi:thiamine-phosphate pyrophosphorylase